MALLKKLLAIAATASLVVAADGALASSAGRVASHREAASSLSKPLPAPRQLVYFDQHGWFERVDLKHPRDHTRLFRWKFEPIEVAGTAHRLVWGDDHGRNQPYEIIRTTDYRGRHERVLVRHTDLDSQLVIAGGFLYWSGGHAIGRVRLDGSHRNPRYASVPQAGGGDDIDGMTTDGRYLYLDQCIHGRFGRVSLSQPRSNRQVQWLATSDNCPQGLDYWDGYLYYDVLGIGNGERGYIGRLRVSSGKADDSWATIHSNAGPFSVVVAGDHIYWTTCEGPECHPAYINRMRLSGAHVQRHLIAGIDEGLAGLP